MTAGFHSLKVTDVRRETEDALSICFGVPDALGDIFSFRPGQHLTLRAFVDGEEVRRNYSVCVAPHEGELRVAIKQVSGGLFSSWANSHVAVGDQIDVMPPHGSFTWAFDPARARHYAAYAAGSGITPVLSLMKTALAVEAESRFVLFYANRSSGSVMFLEQIAALKDRYLERLSIHHFFDDEEGEIALYNGRLDGEKMPEIVRMLMDPVSTDAAFVCGPGPMMDAVEQGLTAAGMRRDQILIERFTAGRLSGAESAHLRQREKQAAGRKMQVMIDGRRRRLDFDADHGSILENARAAGLPAPFACKAGVCATCRARLLSGRVHMAANYGLSAAEVAQGYVLTCQAIPETDDVVLDYDG
ncbi:MULTISPECIES: 1,2-phenylacetyl-CoA epoxidase subunit PaaE [unclassified Sphingopyxis]|uniref:1,2-phenylacetyl-CoA epoxidase subunit PaaE n=1 Tax=unclassified Sphingopyxis TaxID=2614943 RepID=UPI0028644D67|nr:MULTISPECIES: 1,2-phenylacetyl-CoA epoxidase subunit PaaE [unclassified Sphingopyxis]MDR6832440.1 ring-1,2-phenylacetyl-CoA epoxidase subunit PaaE [Sphingopyxis sp. BE122]MDR7228183.1 ring-1,2-phenylacetyl-CoA epoxidase subunit PaaE [Sphingopyxis sp. BE259]